MIQTEVRPLEIVYVRCVADRHYTLKPPWGALIVALLLFGAGATGFAYACATNDRGLVINGLIRLDVGEARTFYGVFAAVFVCRVIAGLISTRRLSGGTMDARPFYLR